jgi:hypothetical protein
MPVSARVTLRQLDALAFDPVDRADMLAIRAFDFHMLANLTCVYHHAFPFLADRASLIKPAA